MRKLGIIAAVVVALIGGLVAAYWIAYPTYSHRYRLTLEVETPEGLKTGSSVIKSQISGQPQLLTDSPGHVNLWGDAVFVDLGNGKNVIALLASGDGALNVDAPVWLAIRAFNVMDCPEYFCAWQRIARETGARVLRPDLMPTLVTFADVNDPKTAQVIQPGELPAVFGSGYRFKRAWIELTNDPVTRTIEQKLPWLVGFKGLTGGGFHKSESVPGKNLSDIHFTR